MKNEKLVFNYIEKNQNKNLDLINIIIHFRSTNIESILLIVDDLINSKQIERISYSGGYRYIVKS